MSINVAKISFVHGAFQASSGKYRMFDSDQIKAAAKQAKKLADVVIVAVSAAAAKSKTGKTGRARAKSAKRRKSAKKKRPASRGKKGKRSLNTFRRVVFDGFTKEQKKRIEVHAAREARQHTACRDIAEMLGSMIPGPADVDIVVFAFAVCRNNHLLTIAAGVSTLRTLDLTNCNLDVQDVAVIKV